MKLKALLMSGIIVSLLLFFNLNFCLGYSDSADCLDIVAGREEVVAEAAEVATGGSIFDAVDWKYQVRIIIGGTLVETRYCSYGEKIILADYIYNGFLIERWSYDSPVIDANGRLINTETVDVNATTVEVTVTQDTRIIGYTVAGEMRTCDRVYMDCLAVMWESGGYPDYVGGAYENDSKWTIYLKENTTENQEKIKGKLYDWQGNTYISCNFSHKELMDVRDKIIKNYVSTGSGIRSVSIACHQWQDGVTEPRVLVVMEGLKNYDSFAEKFYSKYGNKVVVGVYDAVSGVTYPTHAPEKVTVKSAKLKKKKLVIKWSEAEGASKYQIQIFRGKKKIKTVSVKKLSFKYSLKKKKAGKYYVKVRAYGKEAKRWGTWSKKIKAK